MSTRAENADQVFGVLSHRHRRRLLVALGERGGTGQPRWAVDGLSETIAGDGDRRRVRIQLIHCHLPKLDDLGYVDWDREAGTVERGPEWDTLGPFLSAFADHRDRPGTTPD
jgi:hypothetical protein